MPAVRLGERVVASDRSAHADRWNDAFDKVDVTYLAGATCVGLGVIAGVATE